MRAVALLALLLVGCREIHKPEASIRPARCGDVACVVRTAECSFIVQADDRPPESIAAVTHCGSPTYADPCESKFLAFRTALAREGFPVDCNRER